MKYIGSKARIAKDIVPIIQKCIDENEINVYVEPFVGGGATRSPRLSVNIALHTIKIIT